MASALAPLCGTTGMFRSVVATRICLSFSRFAGALCAATLPATPMAIAARISFFVIVATLVSMMCALSDRAQMTVIWAKAEIHFKEYRLAFQGCKSARNGLAPPACAICQETAGGAGTTAVTSISTLARASIRPDTSTQLIAGKFLPITRR